MSYYNQPHQDYCIAISKCLEYVGNFYSSTTLSKFSEQFEDCTLLRLNKQFLSQVTHGQNISNLLVNTPVGYPYLLYKIEQGISNILEFNSSQSSIKMSLGAKNIVSSKVSEEEIWLYLYSYWLRQGYIVKEVDSLYYEVIEPLGKLYVIDTLSCNCSLGIENKSCLHLQLIKWYRSAKLFIKNHDKLSTVLL